MKQAREAGVLTKPIEVYVPNETTQSSSITLESHRHSRSSKGSEEARKDFLKESRALLAKEKKQLPKRQ